MRPESVDRDLLEEEAHTELDRVDKDEVVIFTGTRFAPLTAAEAWGPAAGGGGLLLALRPC